MKIKAIKLVAIAFLMACILPIFLLSGKTSDSGNEISTGLGNTENLLAGYKDWEENYLKNGGDRNMVLPVGWFKGLSTEINSAEGVASLNLIDGIVSIKVEGLPETENWDLWLVENRSGSGRTVMPEQGDTMLRVGSLKHVDGIAKLEANLGKEAFSEFEPELAIVTHAGNNPVQDRYLVGTTTLFHRLYKSKQRGHFGVLDNLGEPAQSASSKGVFDRLYQFFNPTAQAQIGPIPNPSNDLERLITEGRRIFFNETFNGNGRTCGTCHREDNNLTIDPEFISTLQPNDPLFVAEFNPNLSRNFENPVLMRQLGLILENADGFDDLEHKFVMRGVPHTLSMLPGTLKPAVLDEVDRVTPPVLERTGWGGDGAPGTGTLREFLIGAITQHYTKTLNRTPGVDFTLPTSAQLDAVEAFQKSTGRKAELRLAGPNGLSLKNPIARKGQEIFNNPGTVINPAGGFLFNQPSKGAGRCLLCHFSGGASDFFEGVLLEGSPNNPAEGFATGNSNFDTGVGDQPFQPADLLVPPEQNPPDGGFGRDPVFINGKFVGFGNSKATPPPTGISSVRTFNTPVVIEAADTGPFFHNNSIQTIDGAVDFYNSDAFNNSQIGALIRALDPSGIGIHLESTEVAAVAAFLRVVNTLENVRSSVDLESRAKVATSFAQAQELLKLSISELQDAIDVLHGGGLHPEAQRKLRQAALLDAAALITPGANPRNTLIDQALALKNAARADMAK